MPDIRETDEPQRIEVVEKWQDGISGLSDASKTTLDKITETILLALLATTVGTMLSIPISFVAARNLMVNLGSPLAAVMSGIIALPIGFLIARSVLSFLFAAGVGLGLPPFLSFIIGIAIIAGALYLLRSAADDQNIMMSYGKSAVGFLVIVFAVSLLTDFGMAAGDWLEDILGLFGFVGSFVSLISEFVALAAPGVLAFIIGLISMSLGSRYGQEAVLRLSGTPARMLTMGVTGVGFGLFAYGVARFLHWIYQFDQMELWTVYPALGVAVVGLILGSLYHPKRPVPIGSIVYAVVRGILNIIRSIEPLVYVIIFAVWVGIGPFAGVLALTLHTVAALGKLFSEQVENIAEGPLEAITATGANRIQTIVFAVIPQIIPPYIAFTLYRWDINVRMSTIIGFGGGGGIGFVLAQSINLFQYRQASVMMIAIAVVVGLLDYISSRVRARIL